MPLDKLLKTAYQRAPILWFHQKHKEGEGGGELLLIHSLKRNPSERNPNDVLTTCKAIRKGLASGFVY